MKRCIIKYFLLLTFISMNLIIDANAITQQDFINKYLKDRKLEIFEGTWITNSGNIYGVYNNGETFQMIAIESVNFSSGDVIGNFKKASDIIFIGEEKIFYKKKYNVRSRYTIDNNKAHNVLYYQLSNTNLLDYRLWPTDIYEHNDKFMTNNEKVELEAAQLKEIKELTIKLKKICKLIGYTSDKSRDTSACIQSLINFDSLLSHKKPKINYQVGPSNTQSVLTGK